MIEPVRTSEGSALILFLKYPAPGMVKTRIASALGDEFALGLYSAFVWDILDMARKVKADIIAAVEGAGHSDDDLSAFTPGCRIIRQEGDDIGMRMANALSYVFSSGYERAVLIGGDSPDLPPFIIENALASLMSNDAVLGASADGGYYLIGFRKTTFAHAFFMEIAWSTSKVFAQTLEKMESSGLCVSLQREWRDIDDVSDLKLYYSEKTAERNLSSRTMKYLLRRWNGVFP